MRFFFELRPIISTFAEKKSVDMHLERLSILNFKNLEQEEILLDKGFNCFVGDNGTCKTNIIDAIYYLSMTKSSLAMSDTQCVRHGEKFFVVEGDYTNSNGRHEKVVCTYQRGAQKIVKRNGKAYERLADHIGLIPVVIVSPADASLISDSAEERRRYINAFISQLDKSYLDSAMRYNTALANRNSYLKIGSDEEMLLIYDAQLDTPATKIYNARKDITERLRPLVAEYYKALADDHEQVELEYRSELNTAPLSELLLNSRDRDRILQYTSCGIHRDDLRFAIGGYPLRKYGSQGQQKSFLIALKLAQYKIVAEACGEKPILLLDDLFDRLDESRVARLIELVKSDDFGQVIITDCNGERMGKILHDAECSYKLFNVTYGKVENR